MGSWGNRGGQRRCRRWCRCPHEEERDGATLNVDSRDGRSHERRVRCGQRSEECSNPKLEQVISSRPFHPWPRSGAKSVGPTAKPLWHIPSWCLPASGQRALTPRKRSQAKDDFRRREQLAPGPVWTGALARTGVATGTDVAGDPGSVLHHSAKPTVRAALRELD